MSGDAVYHEKKVRKHWDVTAEWGRDYPGRTHPCFHLKLPVIWNKGLAVMFATSPEAAWLAACQFTEERLDQIKNVKEEIAWLSRGMGRTKTKVDPRILNPLERIMIRETWALEELKRYMKETGD